MFDRTYETEWPVELQQIAEDKMSRFFINFYNLQIFMIFINFSQVAESE
jgi:hypothetical protein